MDVAVGRIDRIVTCPEGPSKRSTRIGHAAKYCFLFDILNNTKKKGDAVTFFYAPSRSFTLIS